MLKLQPEPAQKVFTAKINHQQYKICENVLEKGDGMFWKKENLPSVEENQIKKHLNKLGIHKWIGSDGINPQVMRGQVIPSQGHSQLSLKSCGDQGRLMWAARKQISLITSKRARRKYRLLSHTSIPGKVMEQVILEAASSYFKDMKVTERWIYKWENHA